MEDDRSTFYSGGSSMDISTESSGMGTPAPSVYSYNSSRDSGALLRQSEGRIFNAQSTLYLLPAGEFFASEEIYPQWLISSTDEGEYNRL